MKPIKADSQNGFISPELFLKMSTRRYNRHPANIFSDIWKLLTIPPELF